MGDRKQAKTRFTNSRGRLDVLYRLDYPALRPGWNILLLDVQPLGIPQCFGEELPEAS